MVTLLLEISIIQASVLARLEKCNKKNFSLTFNISGIKFEILQSKYTTASTFVFNFLIKKSQSEFLLKQTMGRIFPHLQ